MYFTEKMHPKIKIKKDFEGKLWLISYFFLFYFNFFFWFITCFMYIFLYQHTIRVFLYTKYMTYL
jgi:hypothetical protein